MFHSKKKSMLCSIIQMLVVFVLFLTNHSYFLMLFYIYNAFLSSFEAGDRKTKEKGDSKKRALKILSVRGYILYKYSNISKMWSIPTEIMEFLDTQIICQARFHLLLDVFWGISWPSSNRFSFNSVFMFSTTLCMREILFCSFLFVCFCFCRWISDTFAWNCFNKS